MKISIICNISYLHKLNTDIKNGIDFIKSNHNINLIYLLKLFRQFEYIYNKNYYINDFLLF